MTDDSPKAVRWLPSTGGHVTGWLGLGVAAVIVLATLIGGLPAGWVGIAAVLAWLAWAAMLRPRIGLSGSRLLLRGLISTTSIPLGRIRKVAVQQVFAVWVGDKRYVSAAAGRTRRQILRPRKTAEGTMHPAAAVEDAVRAAMRDAVGSADPVIRTWAWPEIAAGVVALLLLVVLLSV